jgi:hypothetical protein
MSQEKSAAKLISTREGWERGEGSMGRKRKLRKGKRRWERDMSALSGERNQCGGHQEHLPILSPL